MTFATICNQNVINEIDKLIEIKSNPNTLSALTITNKTLHSIFKPYLDINKFINELLCSVSRKQLDKIKNILNINPELMLSKRTFTERDTSYEHRDTSFYASPFQLAVWGKDIAEITCVMVDCLPPVDSNMGIRMRQEMLRQLDEVENDGIQCRKGEQIYYEKEQDIHAMINSWHFTIDEKTGWDNNMLLYAYKEIDTLNLLMKNKPKHIEELKHKLSEQTVSFEEEIVSESKSCCSCNMS